METVFAYFIADEEEYEDGQADVRGNEPSHIERSLQECPNTIENNQ